MEILNYSPEYSQYFEQLNRAWVEKYFQMEPKDEELLLHPEENILDPGGDILFIAHQNQIIGTVAVLPTEPGIYEMAKMAVHENFQGIGAGKLLCQTAIDVTRKRGANKLILFSNTKLKPAISIYRKFGFKEVNLSETQYSRANIKMELTLQPEDLKWFERKFDFRFGQVWFPTLMKRLNDTYTELIYLTNNERDPTLNEKTNGKWSVKEHLGHLYIMETLWQKRFLEFKLNIEEMSPADLNNTATDKGNFTQHPVGKIISQFNQERTKTIQLLNNCREQEFEHRLLHPRLQQPMRIIDLMYFVAEHDRHHINAIRRIIKGSASEINTAPNLN